MRIAFVIALIGCGRISFESRADAEDVAVCPSRPTCVGTACQPTTIVADATNDARGVAVAGEFLVWATGCTGEVRRVDKSGSGNIPLPAGMKCTPTVATRGDRVYWIEWDGPSLDTAPVDGTLAPTIVATVPIAGARANFARLAVDDRNAYWANDDPASIWFAPLDAVGAAPKPIAARQDLGLTVETADAPYGVAVDATHVYWADSRANAIKRRALATLGTDLLAEVVTRELGTRNLALDADRVYWLTTDGLVRSRAKDLASPAITLAVGQTAAESLIVDDRHVYWTTYNAAGTVARVVKTGGTVELLATSQNFPWSIAQDCDTIYWTNHADFGTGELRKMAK